MEIVKTKTKQPPVMVKQGDVIYGGDYYIIADVGLGGGYKLICLGSGTRYSDRCISVGAFASFDIEVINETYCVKFEKVKATLHVEDN